MADDLRQLLHKRRYSQGLEQFLEIYETKVFRMALAILRNPSRAEEVTQDIFLKLWQALPTYDGRAAPGTWLYVIARNACLAAARSDLHRKTIPLDAIREPSGPNPDSRDIELAQLIDRLPEVQRHVIRLFYLEERRVEDVAQMLDLPEGTVKSHLHRARLALAAMLKE